VADEVPTDGTGQPAEVTEDDAELNEEFEAAPITSLLSVTQRKYEIVESQTGVPRIRVAGAQDDEGERSDARAAADTVPAADLISEDPDSSIVGVESLFGAAVGEFEDIGSPEPAQVSETRARHKAQQRSKRIVISDNGIDYDRFLLGYRRNEGGILKSLIEFSRVWNARAAGIFVDTDGGYRLEHAIGIDNEQGSGGVITDAGGIVARLRQGRRALLVKRPIEEYPELVSALGGGSLPFQGRFAFLPIEYRGRPAYFFIGLGTQVDTLYELVRSADLPAEDETPQRDTHERSMV